MKGQTTTGISNAYINSTQYAGNIEYKAEKTVNTAPWNLSYTLDAIYNPEGVVRKLGTELVHHYYRRDYLGNIMEVWRTAYSTTINGRVYNYPASTVQQNNYYPSGLLWEMTYYQNGNLFPYRYNGKEFVGTHGLDEYDSEARWFYPAVIRTTTMDPLAEEYYNISPYAWCGNNPVRYIDPTGMSVELADFYDREGNYLGNDGIDDGKVYLLNEGKRARTEDSRINWGGTLSETHATQLQSASTEVGGLIIQNRIEDGSDYTISEFHTVGGDKNVTGYMLEPAGPSTTTPNQDKRIPEGVYDLQNYSSAKYPDNFLLSNKDVSKSRLILYHSGNTGNQTEGCNMPGSTKGVGRVYDSVTKFKELRTFIKSKGASNVKTIINNKISEKK